MPNPLVTTGTDEDAAPIDLGEVRVRSAARQGLVGFPYVDAVCESQRDVLPLVAEVERLRAALVYERTRTAAAEEGEWQYGTRWTNWDPLHGTSVTWENTEADARETHRICPSETVLVRQRIRNIRGPVEIVPDKEIDDRG
jgi:hypothetical protein